MATAGVDEAREVQRRVNSCAKELLERANVVVRCKNKVGHRVTENGRYIALVGEIIRAMVSIENRQRGSSTEQRFPRLTPVLDSLAEVSTCLADMSDMGPRRGVTGTTYFPTVIAIFHTFASVLVLFNDIIDYSNLLQTEVEQLKGKLRASDAEKGPTNSSDALEEDEPVNFGENDSGASAAPVGQAADSPEDANQKAYEAAKPQLLASHEGHWALFVDGKLERTEKDLQEIGPVMDLIDQPSLLVQITRQDAAPPEIDFVMNFPSESYNRVERVNLDNSCTWLSSRLIVPSLLAEEPDCGAVVQRADGVARIVKHFIV